MKRRRTMKLLRSSLQREGLVSVGGGFTGTIRIALIGFMSWFGGKPSAISMIVIPKDHTSACRKTLATGSMATPALRIGLPFRRTPFSESLREPVTNE